VIADLLWTWLILAVSWDVAYLGRNRGRIDKYAVVDLAFGAIFAPLLWVAWLLLFALPTVANWLGEKVAG